MRRLLWLQHVAPRWAARTLSGGCLSLQVVDCHAGGEPARVVVGGLPPVPGDTMLAKRDYFMAHLDRYRKLLLLEPRGYPCQNANFILPPTSSEVSTPPPPSMLRVLARIVLEHRSKSWVCKKALGQHKKGGQLDFGPLSQGAPS